MRCAIYIRVSRDIEEQKSSLTNQRYLFENYVQDKGWDIHDFYVDVESGTKIDKRASFKKLIEDAKEKKFDVILSKELSRLARNGELSYQIKNVAENNKVHIITLDGAINTLEGNTNMFGMYAWLYEQESQRTSSRVKSAFRAKAEKGYFIGSNPPFGYCLNNGKLVISDGETPNIVKRIFREYLSGFGFDRIARELCWEGIPSPCTVAGKSNSSNLWHGSSVRFILENSHYVGDMVQGKSETISVTTTKRNKKEKLEYIIVKNTHQAIISRADFDAVQQIISSRKRIRPQQNVHLFTNILFCADCGHKMHFKINRKGYVCGNFNKRGSKFCSDHIIREAELSNEILYDIKSMLTNITNDKILEGIEKKVALKKNKLEKELNKCKKDLEKLTNQKNKATSKFINDEISKEDYDSFKCTIDIEIKKTIELEQSYQKMISEKFDKTLLNNLEDLKDSILDLKELTPEILNRFVERIEVKKDGTPIIYYRFSESSIYFSTFFSHTQHSTCTVQGNISTG